MTTLKDLMKEVKEILKENKSAKNSWAAMLAVFMLLIVVLPLRYACYLLGGLAIGILILAAFAVAVAVIIIIIAGGDLDAEEACSAIREA